MKIYLIVLFSMLCFISCGNKKNENKESFKEIGMPLGASRRWRIGKYVYMSSNAILHSNLHCSELASEKDDNGHEVVGVEFIDTDEIAPNYQFFYCKHCFNDEKYVQMKTIIERNLLADSVQISEE